MMEFLFSPGIMYPNPNKDALAIVARAAAASNTGNSYRVSPDRALRFAKNSAV
jgi:hypothetical protein